jgi:hypothetical protein
VFIKWFAPASSQVQDGQPVGTHHGFQKTPGCSWRQAAGDGSGPVPARQVVQRRWQGAELATQDALDGDGAR